MEVIKNPLLLRGFLLSPSGEYEIWTHAWFLHHDGLAIRCITTLPTLHKFCGEDRIRTCNPRRATVFKTAWQPLSTSPWKFIKYYYYLFSFLALIKLEIKHTIVYNDTNCIKAILSIPLVSFASILEFNGIKSAIKINKTKVQALFGIFLYVVGTIFIYRYLSL